MTDYSVEAQPAHEDVANAIQQLTGVFDGDGDEARTAVERAVTLLRDALRKLRSGGTMSDAPKCGNCGGSVTASRITKGRAAGQVTLKCPTCGSRTFISTKAGIAEFEKRYPGAVNAGAAKAPVTEQQTAATPDTGARSAARAPQGEDLSKIAGHRGRRLRGE